MSAAFAPPPPDVAEHRHKPPLCGARLGGSRCDLYRDHLSRLHKDTRTHETWPVEEP